MSKTECIYFEKKLAMHTAPTLLGIKCANLVSLPINEFDIHNHARIFNQKASSKNLKIRVLCECKKRTLILLYSESLLKKCFAQKDIQNLLKSYGYTGNLSLESCLTELSRRISSGNDFPHEIGVFLGYPIEDVIGFIENKGENFKLCGCWKVYGSAEKAKQIFDNYDKCRNFLCNKLNEGSDIYQALKLT